MGNEIIVAIIGGIFGIIASIVPLFIKEYFSNIRKNSISKTRSDVLTGIWEGIFNQAYGHEDLLLEYPIVMDLSVRGKKVFGVFSIKTKFFDKDIQKYTTIRAHFDVTGGFYYEQFLQLNYISRDHAKIQFGSIIFELDAEGKLKGRFVGYGRKTRDIVFGTIQLEKSTEKRKAPSEILEQLEVKNRRLCRENY